MKTILLFLLLSVTAWAADAEITKLPSESFDVSLDFAARASSISLVSCTAIDQHRRVDSTSDVIAYTPSPAVKNTKVIWRVKGGTTGDLHLISIKVTNTLTGETYEGTMLLHVL